MVTSFNYIRLKSMAFVIDLLNFHNMAGTRTQKFTINIGTQEVEITPSKHSVFDVRVADILLGSVCYLTVKGKTRWYSKTGMKPGLANEIGVKISDRIFPAKRKSKRYKIGSRIILSCPAGKQKTAGCNSRS